MSKIYKKKIFHNALPDDLIIKNNCSKEMMLLHKKTNGSVIATKRVEKKPCQDGDIIN